MILLDTNVISEPLRPQPNERVVAWLDSLILEDVYLSAITVAELRLGVALLPDGKKKNVLHERLEQSILPLFAGRILPFDEPVAAIYAQIHSYAKTHGKAIAAADGAILPPLQNSTVWQLLRVIPVHFLRPMSRCSIRGAIKKRF